MYRNKFESILIVIRRLNFSKGMTGLFPGLYDTRSQAGSHTVSIPTDLLCPRILLLANNSEPSFLQLLL